jgi:PAS domain S-box-containing protein
MAQAIVSTVGSLAERVGTGSGLTVLIAVALGSLVLCVVLLALFVSGRRRLARSVREIVGVLEEMRSGPTRRRAEIERDSPLNLVADAMIRLRQDMDGRLQDARNAAERLRAVQDAVRDSAVITTDTDGDIRSFSIGASTLFGWESEEVLTKPASLLFDERSYQEFLPKLARRSLREKGIDSRAVLLRRDGESFPAEVSVRMLRNAARETIGYVIVVRDVTAQARLEKELRESRQRYRGLVEGLADGVLIVRDGKILYANPAFAALTGTSPRALEGTPLRDRIATGEVLLVEESLARLQAKPAKTEPIRCGLHSADASTRLLVSLNAVTIDYLGEAAVLLLVRDETAERRIEAELRRNESQLDAVLESTTDGILVLADSAEGGVVQMTNRAFAELFGLRQEQVLGSSLGKLVRALGGQGGGAQTVAGLLAAGISTRYESVILGGPEPRELEVTVAPLTDRHGAAVGRVLACRDLTREREARRKLQQHAEELQLSKVMLEQAYERLDAANRDLKARTEELDGLNDELRTLDEMKSNLLGNVSHELQTPLVSIRGYTEMILKERLGPLSAEQRKGLTLCLKNIDRLISMIDNLLAFTRTEPELGELKLSRFPLRALVEEAGELLGSKMRTKGIRFALRVEPAELAVRADRDKILQVFLNLLSNAVKFNRQGGSVEVEAQGANTGFVQVRVEDTGVGIPERDLERVFERNYQVETERRPGTEGSGIGLAIVRDILRLHGCRIQVQSEEERGTRFLLTLPAAAKEGSQERAPAAEPVSEAPGPAVSENPSAAAQAAGEPASPDPVEPSAGEGVAPQADEASPTAEDPASDPAAPRPRFRVIRRGDS